MMVPDLLSRSLAEHERAKGLRKVKRSAEATEALTAARDLRLQALSEDPDQSDPAWAKERVPHAEMMEFYSEKLVD